MGWFAQVQAHPRRHLFEFRGCHQGSSSKESSRPVCFFSSACLSFFGRCYIFDYSSLAWSIIIFYIYIYYIYINTQTITWIFHDFFFAQMMLLFGRLWGMHSGSAHILQMRSLRRQLPVAQFAMEQNVAWMDWRWAFFASEFSATHSLASFRWWIHGSPNLLTGWDPAVKLRLQPLLSTGGVWHLKLEKHVQVAAATRPNSCKFHYSYQMQVQDSNSATVFPVLLSWCSCLTLAGAGWWISHCLARFLRKALGLQDRGSGRGVTKLGQAKKVKS